MNLPLFRENARSGWKLFVIFLAVVSMYIAVIVTMYDPELQSSLDMFAEAMPELMAAFGMAATGTTLAGFLSNYLYGFLLLCLPMVFAAMLANRLVAQHVDRGSMAWLAASPNSRGRVAVTQAVTLALSMLLLVALCAALAMGMCAALFPGELDVGGYLRLNLGLFCTLLAVSGICFLASCLFNESKTAISVGAGIPLVFFLLQMLVNMGGKLENLKYATIFTLFDTNGLLEGASSAFFGAAILAAAGLLLYLTGIQCFRRRNLPL